MEITKTRQAMQRTHSVQRRIDLHRTRMEVLILWAIAGGKQTLQEFTTLLGLAAKSSILTMYIRPMEEAGFISRDRLSSGRAPHHSLRLTAKGMRRLSEYAILRYQDRLEIYQVVARYGEGGELEDYK